jgi:hypothetical protein
VQRAESRAAHHELQVLADRDRIGRGPARARHRATVGIGLTLRGTQHLAKSPAVAARIADHIDQLNQVTEIRTAVVDLHTDPADPVDRAIADTRNRIYPLHGLDPYAPATNPPAPPG